MTIELSVAALWLAVFVQSALIAVLFRQVGLNLLARSEAISRDGPEIGQRLPPALAKALNEFESQFPAEWSRLIVIFARHRCGVCHKLWPELRVFVASPSASRVAVAIVFDGDAAAVTEYRRKHALNGVILSDSKERLFDAARVRVSPFGIVVDRRYAVTRKGLVNHQEHLRLLTEVGADADAGEPQLDKGDSHAIELAG